MNTTKLNLLSKLKDLQATSETLLEVAIYLETEAKTTPSTIDNAFKLREMSKLADKCRVGIASIDSIL